MTPRLKQKKKKLVITPSRVLPASALIKFCVHVVLILISKARIDYSIQLLHTDIPFTHGPQF